MNPSGRKAVLVTGSATGVGRATAIRFARENFDVVVNYPGEDESEALQTVDAVESAGARSLLVRCDVSRPDEIDSMAAAIDKTFGRLDVLVNNAGVTSFVDHSDLAGMTEDKWDRILAVNTKGPFFVIRSCLPLMEKLESAAIVNVSSAAGISGFGSSIAYCASKGGLNTLTKSMASCLAPRIRVNAVCPGPINSRWLRSSMSEKEIEQRAASLPLARLIQPEEIADTIFYLAAGTPMTTGQLLVVDGGRTV
ncbi:MAG: SDR family oxidoreductase [Planctomycetota bacterium]|nr:SDR family oxidoreductase [Planctomycetota bacterium]